MTILITIDGGGMNGMNSGALLVELEKRTGKKIHEFTSAIAGTSIGAVMAASYAQGIAASEVMDFFKDYKDQIFKNNFAPYILHPKHPGYGIEDALKATFKDTKVGDVKIPFMCVAKNETTGQPAFFKSFEDSKETLMRDALRASTAAPTYFPYAVINDEAYSDGGLIANNPASLLWNDFMESFSGQVILISFGNGIHKFGDPLAVKKANSGALHFVLNYFGTFLDTESSNIDYEMKRRMKKLDNHTYIRLNPLLKYHTTMDDPSDAAYNQRIENGQYAIQQFDGILDQLSGIIRQM